ncbi:MAG: phosphocholine cytidylyltransferase family protein [Phycisphaerae bacterium]|nr:phosphocholine cytidylyltransferase family protein [Phycisphaerae bacterium]
MKAIILAAGAGRRLGAAVPKCMLDVGGMSIIHRQLAALSAEGIEEYVVVVGYEQDRVREHLAGRPGRFTFVVNEQYASTNTVYSLYLAASYLTGTCWYTNADVVFDRRLIRRLADDSSPAALAVQNHPCGEEEVKVIVREGLVVRIGKAILPAEAGGEFLGVARLNGDVAAALARTLSELVEQQGVIADYFERGLDRLCGEFAIRAVDVTDLPCHEIDFPADLKKAQREIAPRLEE